MNQSIAFLKILKPVDVLINNAGNAHGLDDVVGADLDDWDAMIDGNVKGLMYVTKAVLPQMTEQKKGQIINIGSIAGLEVYPKGNVYCASKFAVDAFTQGLRIDLNAYGIRVGAIHPGLVETEFSEVRFKGDQKRCYGLQPIRRFTSRRYCKHHFIYDQCTRTCYSCRHNHFANSSGKCYGY